MDSMILLLFITSLTAQQVFGQEGALNDKNDAKVPSGWNNRHQHFTMHFGKRLERQEPLSVLAQPRAYDLYPVEQHPHQAAMKFPYWLSIQLERGQTLDAIPPAEEQVDTFKPPMPKRMPMYTFEQPTQAIEFAPFEQQYRQQQQQVQQQMARQQLDGQKLLKLISGSAGGDGEGPETPDGEKVQPSSNLQEDGKQQPAINVSTRSMQNQIKLPKHFIPVLFGAGSNFGSYNKKAEPRDNFFMHFGKK